MNWQLFFESLPALSRGALINIQITLIAFAFGLLIGIGLALMEKSKFLPLRAFAVSYNTFFRGTPILIQIFFLYYGLPLLGVSLPALFVVTSAVALNSGAYSSQIILTGMNSISEEQFHAAKVLSFNKFQAYRHIILPQCFRKTIPAFSSEVINLLKDSSLASIVGINEIVKIGNLIRGRTYETFAIFLGISLIYLLMTSGLTFFTKKAEKWSKIPCSI